MYLGCLFVDLFWLVKGQSTGKPPGGVSESVSRDFSAPEARARCLDFGLATSRGGLFGLLKDSRQPRREANLILIDPEVLQGIGGIALPNGWRSLQECEKSSCCLFFWNIGTKPPRRWFCLVGWTRFQLRTSQSAQREAKGSGLCCGRLLQ